MAPRIREYDCRYWGFRSSGGQRGRVDWFKTWSIRAVDGHRNLYRVRGSQLVVQLRYTRHNEVVVTSMKLFKGGGLAVYILLYVYTDESR